MQLKKRLDLIDREKLFRKMFYVEEKSGGHGWVVSLEDISKAPEVDAVEVVRCKDCTNRPCNKVCKIFKRQMNDDCYCSYGERKS